MEFKEQLDLSQSYYLNAYTKESQWERPTKPAEPPASRQGAMDQVRCSHILVKHRESRRPSSWRQDHISRSKEEALDIIKGQSYYLNAYTKESQWERPTKPAEPPASRQGAMDQVRCSHILVKHRESRRPSSWRQDHISRSKEEALDIIKGRNTTVAASIKLDLVG
ncbi:PIN1 [Cordylochernes scorpioides]|uniref:peptidylprolyl isomerase n=1 Tax=Cordylochernes scorpioides TaxID=51811 RepID=A0ABY6KXD9_9ARAC|nr:PIN1 [Cordylochernes scorpioides]